MFRERMVALLALCLVSCSGSGADNQAYCSPAVFTGTPSRPFGSGSQPLTCRTLELQTSGGSLQLAVAAKEADREHGLMFVHDLPPDVGILFVFVGESRHSFWMKNTLIPLDMLFIDAFGKVTSVAENVPASTESTPENRVATRDGFGRYVIELAAGSAKRLHLQSGSKLAIPFVDARE
ncbi:MAG TPA: DUF192 domain-containing protein [Candidatus Baltobacteraceae bacterium]|nr:DUF192 domain-containing protein [Candidatus Baltobacteraceae bacterium]